MDKTKELLYCIIKQHKVATITVLMKLSYIIDLVSKKQTGQKISNFSYKRYFYGPFDSSIYSIVEKMQNQDLISAELIFSEDKLSCYAVYKAKKSYTLQCLTQPEKDIINEVLTELKDYSAKTLTEITYKTKPMEVLGATLGGTEHLNEDLNLDTTNE
ncbi:SocA family protein [Candidatus Dojkabacteria bacterium]|jgi:uncharacterized phage-associated protein|nr:SocA family protein [Candidatus Dojkabacteria bacterium]